jgi:serine/threonine-protein kinase
MSKSTIKITKRTYLKGYFLPLLRNLKTNEIVEVARKKVVIGRHSGDDMTINDAKCSRGNTEVEFVDGKFFVRDRGSRNGTSLNGVPIKEPIQINYGDKILIGATEIEFQKSPEKVNIEITGYEIIEHIASGGMGKVYKARQISLDRIVAIKVLAPKFTNNPRLTENFINEARSAGRLNHPNLVQVHDVNKDFQKNGQVIYYFTMEFIDGKTLKELIRDSEKLPALQVIDLLIDISKGLEYIHNNKLIHRDIKPDNIMIDGDGNLKIADLGIALDANETEVNEPTEDGQRRIVGTPHYISPEQVRGKGVDTRSDIYSLGATAFHMLTGETPFEGNSSKEIIKKHITEEPKPISDLNPDVPPIVCDLVQKMMSKKPEDRPQSANLLREELEQIKTKLEKGKSRTKVTKINKSNNYLIQFSAILIGLSIAAGYFYFAESRELPKQKKPIETNPEIANADALLVATQTKIQTKIQQAQDLSRSNNYQKALDIYNAIKTEYPNNSIITEVDALIKIANLEIEKQKQKMSQDDIAVKYNEIQAFKNQNPNDATKVLAKFEEFIVKYPSAAETKLAQAEVDKLKGDKNRLDEIQKLEAFKRTIESSPKDEDKLALITANKNSFTQKESKVWFAEKTQEINSKLEALVASATKDAESLDMNIANENYDLALARAQSFLDSNSYIKAKNVINLKIAEIESKASLLKDTVIKDCSENLAKLDYSEVLITIEGKINKLAKTKAHEELTKFSENVKACQDIHFKILKMVDGKTDILYNCQKTEGAFDVEYKIHTVSSKGITFAFKGSKDKEVQNKTYIWQKLEKYELYLIYESILIFNDKTDEYKTQLAAVLKIHNINEGDLKEKRLK